MAFLLDAQELKTGLIIFRRADVKHRNWYCRIKLPNADRYKTVALRTADIDAARERAFDQDADLRFRIKHDVPVFNRPFSQIAKDYVALQEERVEAGEITRKRWKTVESVVNAVLNPYVGSTQITLIGQDRWTGYPLWRRKNGKGVGGGRISDAAIRLEMSVFRAIMAYAAGKKYVADGQVFKGKLQQDKARREEFSPEEYRKLHTFARSWIKRGRSPLQVWYRTVVYNFVLVMCNTGMRPAEAKNLRWRDVTVRSDRQERKFIILHVRGKGKFRNLVAAENVAEYIERIRAISKATGPDDFVFTTADGKPAASLYDTLIETLLEESGLLQGPSGKRRTTYCFRHTYATFRLTEGVDVYFLAQQMGTSVQMIEQHYGHIVPTKNADRILQGMPGWESAAVPQIAAEPGRVNADEAKSQTANPRRKATLDT